MKVQPIYNSNILKKTLKFAANNSSLFTASVSLVLSTIVRPIVINTTPKTDKINKEYASTKSLASSAAGYLIMLTSSLPLAKAIKNIDKNPEKYLKQTTIETLKAGKKVLTNSKRYTFATQLFKLGLGFVIAAPKSILTCALIPPIMSKIYPQNKNKDVSFTGKSDFLSKIIGKIIDTKPVKKFVNKFYKTNYEQHIMSLTDVVSAGTFIHQTAKSKKIEQDRKKTLMYNTGISTAFCLAGGYALNAITPISKFIKKFIRTNKNSPELEKYIEGVRVAKPALILGGIYYIVIPLISTFLADRFDRREHK